jgi:hypothetical protein
MRDAVMMIQSVEAWEATYPFNTVADRIVEALFESESVEDAISGLLNGLSADCKELLAYAPIFGFNLVDDATISFGKCVLQALGEERVESEIIGRLKQHVSNLEEPLRSKEIERFRKYLVKHQHVPILRVPYFGSTDGAEGSVCPIAERVATFMQFSIGMLTDQNTHIIDHRGRYTGEFSVLMPVMTPEYDQISFPNIRGFPNRVQIRPEDVARLEALGVLSLTSAYVEPIWAPRKSTNALLCRAISCFADGERGVTDSAKIVSYVSAMEVFFNRREAAEEAFCIGVAAATHNEHESLEEVYQLARVIYDQRSRAAHEGHTPTFAFIARRKAKESVLRIIQMRSELATKKDINEWVLTFADQLDSKPEE